MADESNLPRRRLRLTLDLQADSWREMEQALSSIAYRMCEQERSPDEPVNVVSGGCGSGFVLDVKVNTAQTAEGYQRDLRAYLDSTRSKP